MLGVTPAIVLYAHDLIATRQCYVTIGLSFVEEQHGDGPVHYACDFEGIVLELYPLRAGSPAPKPCEAMALVFYVDAFERTLSGLKAMELTCSEVREYDLKLGLRAVSVRDPDGRLVRLLERDPRVVQ